MESVRQRQVNELVKRHFSQVLIEQGRTIYGDAMVSVTNVQVSPDLSQSRIYLSIFNADNKDEIIQMINMHHHQLKQALAHRIRRHVRRIPQVEFYLDELVDEIYRVDKLFDKIDVKSEEE